MRNADNIRLTPPPQERGRLVRAKHGLELGGGPPALRSLPIPVQWHNRAWRPRLRVRLELKAEGGRQKAETQSPGSSSPWLPACSTLPYSRTASIFRNRAGRRTLF